MPEMDYNQIFICLTIKEIRVQVLNLNYLVDHLYNHPSILGLCLTLNLRQLHYSISQSNQ